MAAKPSTSKVSRFEDVDDDGVDHYLDQRKRPNTNQATKLWLTCFTDYLAAKSLPKVDDIELSDLPRILEKFYAEVRKKEITANPETGPTDNDKLYKNTTLKAIRAALGRYFKEKRSIDIMSNEAFIRSNQVFEGVLKVNKEKGKGFILSKPPIEDIDLAKLTKYFQDGMAGPPNPVLLQECCLFYIVMYMCRRGRENLRNMTVETFKFATDPEDGRQYIYQDIDEADKNHNHHDMTKSNDGRIYEVPGV